MCMDGRVVDGEGVSGVVSSWELHGCSRGMRVICYRVCTPCMVVLYVLPTCHASPSELVTRSLIPGPAPSLPRLTISYGKTNEYR